MSNHENSPTKQNAYRTWQCLKAKKKCLDKLLQISDQICDLILETVDIHTIFKMHFICSFCSTGTEEWTS